MRKKDGNRKRASKKLLATILSLCMSVGMMPVSSQQVYADEEKWTEWTASDSLPTTSGRYVLTSDVTVAGDWTLGSNQTIELSLGGYSIDTGEKKCCYR